MCIRDRNYTIFKAIYLPKLPPCNFSKAGNVSFSRAFDADSPSKINTIEYDYEKAVLMLNDIL